MCTRASQRTWDEAERISALHSYDILDTPPEPDFDDLVRLIAQICQVPRAGISLIDHQRQWFKAEIGLGFKETPIDISICPGLALEPGLTVIPDVREDRRLAANALVTGGPQIRFYAGVRLETSEGIPLGTLCVLDDEVRDLDEGQRFGLLTLARQVMSMLELRRALAQRDRAIAGRDRAKANQALLTRELHHRVKNTLAVVQAVAGSTGRSATNVTQYQTALSGRIGALAKAHAVITEDDSQSASLLSLLQLELGGFGKASAGRVTLDGPDVKLASETAVPLGLAIHELTTNSARYGALSAAEGCVEVAWEIVEDGPAEPALMMRWIEHGGPTVVPPERHGFGTRMLSRVLGAQIGAQVTSDFHPDGFRLQLRFPLVAPAGQPALTP
ncbi:sensor histidine kinase [uncultured Enterovirga sp.]|uniref:sensor histidine kinase n=1 Tax=uncultured Enterovirga sp. TaxID=2026352 RepID=UPI0035CC153B